MKTSVIAEKLKGYKPEKIILFGSRAWGKPKADSDIDLLIVKNTKKNPYKRIPEARKFLRDINSPVDVLVFTSEEISRRLQAKDFFISEIFEKGKILYEAKQR